MSNSPTIGSILAPDRNSFTLMRLVAAVSVLLSHSFSLPTAHVTDEPLFISTHFTLGQHAVNAFFFLSGLTLAHSLFRSPDIESFARARFLRLFPGLLVYGLVFTFIAGPLLTTLPLAQYFTEAHTYLYPLKVLVEFSQASPPHGIFLSAPYAGHINDPLWTIKYEIVAYLCLGALFTLGLLRHGWALLAGLGLTFAITVATAPPSIDVDPIWLFQVGRYGFCFLLGVLAHHYRDHVRLRPWLLLPLMALAYMLTDTAFGPAANIVAVVYLVLVGGSFKYGRLSSWAHKNDLSYGVYIYGWPIQQTLIGAFPGISSALIFVSSLGLVLAVAMASWKFVEKPALKLKKRAPQPAPAEVKAQAQTQAQLA